MRLLSRLRKRSPEGDEREDLDERDVPTLEVINNELSQVLARQREDRGRIDTKLILLLGFSATAAQFLVTRDLTKYPFEIAAYASYSISFAAGTVGAAVQRFSEIEPRALFNEFAAKPKAEVLAALCAARVIHIERNQRKQRRKRTLWWISLGSLTLGITLSMVALYR